MAEAFIVFEGSPQNLTEEAVDLYLPDQKSTVGFDALEGEWNLFPDQSVESLNRLSAEVPDDFEDRLEQYFALKQSLIEDARDAIRKTIQNCVTA